MSLICGQTVTTRSLRTVEEEVGEAGRGTAVEPSPSWFVVEERLRFLVGTSWTCTWILVTFFCSHSFWIVASVRSFVSLALRFFHRNITCFMVHLLARPHGIDVIGYALPNVVFSFIGHFSSFAELKRPTIEAKLPRTPSCSAQVSATVKLGPFESMVPTLWCSQYWSYKPWAWLIWLLLN